MQVKYTAYQLIRLKDDPFADFGPEHDAIVEVLEGQIHKEPTDRQLDKRAHWRRIDEFRKRPLYLSDPAIVEGRTNDDPAVMFEEIEELQCLTQALASLSQRDLQIISSRYFQRKPLREIAASCGCSAQAVHQQEKRVIERLRIYMNTKMQ